MLNVFAHSILDRVNVNLLFFIVYQILFLSISHHLADVILKRFIKKAENKSINHTKKIFFMIIVGRIKDTLVFINNIRKYKLKLLFCMKKVLGKPKHLL